MFFSKIRLVFVFALVGLIYINCTKNTKSDARTVSVPSNSNLIHFVFTSDPHYGLTKASFQGANNVDASIVNAALINKLNSLNSVTLPNDGGVDAGQTIDFVDCVISGGDIANK